MVTLCIDRASDILTYLLTIKSVSEVFCEVGSHDVTINQSTFAEFVVPYLALHDEGVTLRVLSTESLTDPVWPRSSVYHILTSVFLTRVFKELLSATRVSAARQTVR